MVLSQIDDRSCSSSLSRCSSTDTAASSLPSPDKPTPPIKRSWKVTLNLLRNANSAHASVCDDDDPDFGCVDAMAVSRAATLGLTLSPIRRAHDLPPARTPTDSAQDEQADHPWFAYLMSTNMDSPPQSRLRMKPHHDATAAELKTQSVRPSLVAQRSYSSPDITSNGSVLRLSPPIPLKIRLKRPALPPRSVSVPGDGSSSPEHLASVREESDEDHSSPVSSLHKKLLRGLQASAIAHHDARTLDRHTFLSSPHAFLLPRRAPSIGSVEDAISRSPSPAPSTNSAKSRAGLSLSKSCNLGRPPSMLGGPALSGAIYDSLRRSGIW